MSPDPSFADRGCGVSEAGTGDQKTGGGPARGESITVGHKACALLVPRRDMGDPAIRQSAIEFDRVDAGNTKCMGDPVLRQKSDQVLSESPQHLIHLYYVPLEPGLR